MHNDNNILVKAHYTVVEYFLQVSLVCRWKLPERERPSKLVIDRQLNLKS